MEYVSFDPENGDLHLQLPESYLQYQEELYVLLADKFLSEDINDQTLERMNAYVAEWLKTR
ncbi:hypothetical protein KAR34_12315 [bacterium]|nr:hypothetical protein [bacterium]